MRISIIAGEASGDLLGAQLMRSILKRVPHAQFDGIGGPQMSEVGFNSVYPMERLSVMGLVEVVGRFVELIPVRRRLAREYIQSPPDVFIGIDAPDFNITLERKLKRHGIPTVHYVSPSVWAWRRYRVRKIRRAVDLMLTLFPFEESFYRDRGIHAEFVGHPLADLISDEPDRDAARQALHFETDATVVALLPGSRVTEVGMLSERMVKAARWLVQQDPTIKFVVPLVNDLTADVFEEARLAYGQDIDITFANNDARTAMSAADVVLVASGTASLEAMLLRRPMVITYRTAALTWAIGRRLLHVDNVGLPNLLAGERIVPELLQDDATPEALGTAVYEFVQNPVWCRKLKATFARLHRELKQNASERAADAVLKLVGS